MCVCGSSFNIQILLHTVCDLDAKYECVATLQITRKKDHRTYLVANATRHGLQIDVSALKLVIEGCLLMVDADLSYLKLNCSLQM